MNTNNLNINGFDATELVKKFGTPLYVYNGEQINKNFAKINSAIPYKQKQIHYAVMCNDRPEILKILLKLGSYIQANSLKEYKLARRVGFSNEKISVTTTNISPDDMKKFIKYEALINFDSIEEVKRYGELAANNKKANKKIGIRIFVNQKAPKNATNSPYSPKARVGIALNKFNELKKIAKQFNLKIIGVHGYLASNMLELAPFIKLNKILFECAKKFFDLEYINFGAGFGLALKPNEKDFDWKKYGENVVLIMKKAEKFFGREINLKIEPGRSLVGDAGILLTKVTNIKDMGSWQEVGVDSGFGIFARPFIYNWNDEGYHSIVAASKVKEKKDHLYTICGNSVLQGDYLAEDRKLPKLEISDLLAILKTGAYGAKMMSGFPGKDRAKEVLIYNNRIIGL